MKESIFELFKLNGRTALITGGNRGLGLAMAKALAEAGANVSIAARDHNASVKALEMLQSAYGSSCIHCFCDVTSEASVHKAVDKTVAAFGKIDILINSAGINIRGPIAAISSRDFNKVMEVNVTGTWLACRAVIPGMRKNGWGKVSIWVPCYH